MSLNYSRITRAAVLAMFFSCVVVFKGSYAVPVLSVHPEDSAQAAIRLSELGVPLEKDPKGNVRWIEAKKGELKDESMRLLPHLPKLEWLEMGNGMITQDGMKHLGKCTALKRLYVHDIDLKGQELSWISNLKQLEALSLQSTQIDGTFLKYLDTVDSLKVLNLSENRITNEDMAQIARFKNLEVLALSDTLITGPGIAELEGMARLNELNIRNCGIQNNDLRYFLSMPNLRIVYADGCYLSDWAVGDIITRFPSLAIFR